MNRYKTILLFGMPGSGKGTQGGVLGQLPNYVHISCGDVFRKLPKYGTLGKEVVHYTSLGEMVPDDLTVRIWERHIQILEMQELLLPDQHTLVLDGLPRNYTQAVRLDHMLDVSQIVYLVVEDLDKAYDRLRARALRENRLDDMSDEVIKRRFRSFEEETLETLAYYDPGLVFKVDASQEPLFVLRDIVNRLADIKSAARVRAGVNGA